MTNTQNPTFPIICSGCGDPNAPIYSSTREILSCGTLFECSHCGKQTIPQDYTPNLEGGEVLALRQTLTNRYELVTQLPQPEQDDEENPNRPTPQGYCACCAYAPCLYTEATLLGLCTTLMAQPLSPMHAAADMITELCTSHPEMTRQQIHTLLRDVLNGGSK